MPYSAREDGTPVWRAPKHVLQRLHEIRKAATMLYFAGMWALPDETVANKEQQANLWEQMRDALELPVGTYTQVEKELEE